MATKPASKKFTREEIVELAVLRNRFTGHTELNDDARIKLPKTATDDQLRAALDATLTRDFNEDFGGGKDISKLPPKLLVYMTDVLGLDSDADEEETLEVADEEEIDLGDDSDAASDDDEIDLGDDDETETSDDAGDDDEIELDDEETSTETAASDDDDEIELDDEEPVAKTPAKKTPPAPAKPAPVAPVQEKVAATLTPASTNGSSLEAALEKILEALANDCEIIIRAKSRSGAAIVHDSTDGVRVASQDESGDDGEEEEVAKPKSAAAKGKDKKGDAASGKKITSKEYTTAAYNAARGAIKDTYTNPKMRVAMANQLKAKARGKNPRPLAEMSERGITGVLLQRIVDLAKVQFSAAPNSSKNDARKFAQDTLAASKKAVVEKAKAQRDAKAASGKK